MSAALATTPENARPSVAAIVIPDTLTAWAGAAATASSAPASGIAARSRRRLVAPAGLSIARGTQRKGYPRSANQTGSGRGRRRLGRQTQPASPAPGRPSSTSSRGGLPSSDLDEQLPGVAAGE